MTTFVLCNECGNRWKVCLSACLPPPSPTDPAPNEEFSPHIPERPHARGACQPTQSRPAEPGRVAGCSGQRERAHAYVSSGRAPSWGGSGILHFIGGWASPPLAHRWNLLPEVHGGEGRQWPAHGDPTSLQSAFTDGGSSDLLLLGLRDRGAEPCGGGGSCPGPAGRPPLLRPFWRFPMAAAQAAPQRQRLCSEPGRDSSQSAPPRQAAS